MEEDSGSISAKLHGSGAMVSVSNVTSGGNSSTMDFFQSEGIMSFGDEMPTIGGGAIGLPGGIGEKGLPSPVETISAAADHKIAGSAPSQLQPLQGINPEGASLSNIGVPAGTNMQKGGNGIGIG